MEIFDRLAIGDQLMRLQWKDHEEGLRKFYSFFYCGFLIVHNIGTQHLFVLIFLLIVAIATFF